MGLLASVLRDVRVGRLTDCDVSVRLRLAGFVRLGVALAESVIGGAVVAVAGWLFRVEQLVDTDANQGQHHASNNAAHPCGKVFLVFHSLFIHV